MTDEITEMQNELSSLQAALVNATVARVVETYEHASPNAREDLLRKLTHHLPLTSMKKGRRAA